MSYKNRTKIISVRVNEREFARLCRRAGEQSVSSYLRQAGLRGAGSMETQKIGLLCQIVTELSESNALSNLGLMARSAMLDEEDLSQVQSAVEQASICLTDIRRMLLESLGRMVD